MTSSKPSSQRRGARKKAKEPSPESKEEEESTTKDTGSSNDDQELEEEAEPTTPLPEKRKRMDTQASHKKKPIFAFKISIIPKQLVKTPMKGESSQKKPRGK